MDDLLALLETAPSLPCDDVSLSTGTPNEAGIPNDQWIEIPLQPRQSPEPSETAPASRAVKLPSMVGKVGGGRHGEGEQRALLALHMRHCKSLLKPSDFRHEVADLLTDTTFKKDGNTLTIRARATSSGLVLKIGSKSSKGNRFQRAVPWDEFFKAAYGRLKRTTHIALSLDRSKGMVNFMTAMVGSVYQGQQLTLLTKLLLFADANIANSPLICIQQFKWDETSLVCSVNADRSGNRVRSTWEVMVARARVILVWQNGSSIIIRLVMPPVVLLGSAAHHIFYALRYHPAYKRITGLLDMLASKSLHRAKVFESDGAYANERLYAQLLQLNKVADYKYLMLHMKCQNHQTQLVNVSVLACVGHNILNRLYGMTVFLRNLGQWMRIKQALYTWVDANLVFRPHVMSSNIAEHAPNHAALLELVSFLRDNHKFRAESSEQRDNFERKVRFFLEMWNGDTGISTPCHVCSHESLPAGEKHCSSRKVAVRKCVDSLLDLFLHSMPSVPAPNKWTTLHGPLDPCRS